MMQIIICATLALIIGYLLGHARGYGKARNYYQNVYQKEIDKLKEILHVLAECGDDKNAME